jgi:hypothetical protein
MHERGFPAGSPGEPQYPDGAGREGMSSQERPRRPVGWEIPIEAEVRADDLHPGGDQRDDRQAILQDTGRPLTGLRGLATLATSPLPEDMLAADIEHRAPEAAFADLESQLERLLRREAQRHGINVAEFEP